MTTKKPTLLAYTVKNRGRNQRAIWTRIGAAWAHNTGEGFNIELEAFPVDGRIVLVPPKADDIDDAMAPDAPEDEEGGAQ